METNQQMATKAVLITGASSGIGRALAVEFAKTGEYNIGIVARRVEKLRELKEEILKVSPHPIKVEYRRLDVTDINSIPVVFDQIVQALGGKLDVVVANAGVFLQGPVGGGDLVGTKRTIDTNITGAFATIDTAIAHFRKMGGGHLVGLSSVVAFMGDKNLAVYSATKAAMRLYLNVLDDEVRQEGITVSSIHPIIVETQFTADMPTQSHFITATNAAERIMNIVKTKSPRGLVPFF